MIDALFPDLEAHASGYLPVSGIHRLYWESAGAPQGEPVVFVHGGPGGGCSPWNRRLFHPDFWRVILFDQRGCGRSTPFASLHENTTADLIADMERLRVHLGVERWLVFGGSWGSTLALAYAQAHPDRVTGLVLRGVFLASRPELQWFYGGGAGRFFPAAWQAFSEHVPAEERADLITAYYRRLCSHDQAEVAEAALAWTRWEMACSRLEPNLDPSGVDVRFALALARIETHYFVHDAWLRPGQLLDGVARIKHLPCHIVQGRYDMVCPPVNAWHLAQRWPRARLHILTHAGHSALEPAILGGLIAATEALRLERA